MCYSSIITPVIHINLSWESTCTSFGPWGMIIQYKWYVMFYYGLAKSGSILHKNNTFSKQHCSLITHLKRLPMTKFTKTWLHCFRLQCLWGVKSTRDLYTPSTASWMLSQERSMQADKHRTKLKGPSGVSDRRPAGLGECILYNA